MPRTPKAFPKNRQGKVVKSKAIHLFNPYILCKWNYMLYIFLTFSNKGCFFNEWLKNVNNAHFCSHKSSAHFSTHGRVAGMGIHHSGDLLWQELWPVGVVTRQVVITSLFPVSRIKNKLTAFFFCGIFQHGSFLVNRKNSNQIWCISLMNKDRNDCYGILFDG